MVKECDREWVVVQQNVAVERREFCAMKWSSRSGGGAEVEEEEQRRAERERERIERHTHFLVAQYILSFLVAS